MAPTRSQKLTQTDKLRAMNNLQSEITRRARSLRAEYARAAQGLRSKLEMRVYRIPKALRSANMGELLQKYIDMQDQGEAKTEKAVAPVKDSARAAAAASSSSRRSPAANRKTQTTTAATKAKAQNARPIDHSTSGLKPTRTAQAGKTRGTKRTSDIMIAADNNGTDKENEESVENPKKRVKDEKQRTASRPLRDPSAVLSPKSNNSRNLPQSPVKPTFGMPSKGYSSRPASPLKAPTVSRIPPASPVRQAAPRATAASTAGTTRAATTRATKAATTASTRAGTTGTRTATARSGARSASNSTNDSTGTTGTTIVRRGAISRAGGTAAAAAKKTTATASTAASARRTAATRAKAEPKPEAAAPTRRVLRKRA